MSWSCFPSASPRALSQEQEPYQGSHVLLLLIPLPEAEPPADGSFSFPQQTNNHISLPGGEELNFKGR